MVYLFRDDFHPGGPLSLRPRYAAAGFAAYFLVIGYLGWDTASRTTGAWYDQATTQMIYQTNLIAGVLLLAGLLVVLATASRTSVITREPASSEQSSRSSPTEAQPTAELPDQRAVDSAIEVLEGLETDIKWLDREISDEFQSLFRTRQETQDRIRTESLPSENPNFSLETSRDPSSFIALAGPAIVAIGYLAISAILLPGAGGFLIANYQLNTAVILGLSYGWPGLGLYVLLATYMMLRPSVPSRRIVERRQEPM